MMDAQIVYSDVKNFTGISRTRVDVENSDTESSQNFFFSSALVYV